MTGGEHSWFSSWVFERYGDEVRSEYDYCRVCEMDRATGVVRIRVGGSIREVEDVRPAEGLL